MNAGDERYTRKPTIDWCLALIGLKKYTLDVAACRESHWAKRYYTKAQNGLVLFWEGDVWANVPFSIWDQWLPKAWLEWQRGDCRSITMLLPNDKTEQPAWHEHVAPYRDRRGSPLRTFELPGRPRFAAPGTKGVALSRGNGGSASGSPFFGCIALVWHRRFMKGTP